MNQSPFPSGVAIFCCCEKYHPMDKIRSPLDQDPYLWSKYIREQVVATFTIDITRSIK